MKVDGDQRMSRSKKLYFLSSVCVPILVMLLLVNTLHWNFGLLVFFVTISGNTERM